MTRLRRHTVSSVQPRGHETHPLHVNGFHDISRQDTLFGDASKSDNTASGLKTLLGGTKSKLKPKSKLAGPEIKGLPVLDPVSLERTSSQSRVELDLFLENDASVQGGFIKGVVEIHVRRQHKQKYPILLAGGKLRVIGFESILDGKERAAFYQCSASLSSVAPGTHRLYTSELDSEGFARTAEGVYTLPFSLPLPLSTEFGKAKGKIPDRSGAFIRYIVMVSIRVKDHPSNKKSIAHFYRDCTVWPRLDPSLVLAPASAPLEACTPPETGVHKPHLTIQLHRSHWVAGQQCFIQIHIINNSTKTLKSATLELFQSTTMFKRGLHHDSLQQDKVDTALNACQATTVNKKVSEAVLTACQSGMKAHASAKGWWSGVPPGEHQTFTHSILIPADALSISRSHLLEVSYMLQVVVGAGSLLSSDTHVAIPLQIINFLSIDPPPVISPSITSDVSVDYLHKGNYYPAEPGYPTEHGNLLNENPVLRDGYDGGSSVGDRQVHEDDDLLVQHVVSSARPDAQDAPKFADVYYQTLQDSLDLVEEKFHDRIAENSQVKEHDGGFTHRPPSHTFALRIQEKQHTHDKARSVDVPKSSGDTTSSSIDQAISQLNDHRGFHSGSRTGSHPKLGDHISSSTLSDLEPHSYFGENMPNKLEAYYMEASYPALHTAKSMGRMSTHSEDQSPTKLHSRLGPQKQYKRSSNREIESDDNINEYHTHTRQQHDASSTAYIPRPSAMRMQSVKDKIRELEEKCASSSSGGDI